MSDWQPINERDKNQDDETLRSMVADRDRARAVVSNYSDPGHGSQEIRKTVDVPRLSPNYLEQMRAHVDEGGQLSHRNGLDLLAEVERLQSCSVTLTERGGDR